MATEALSCFEDLASSIPRWIAELREITNNAAVRQRQFLLENQDSVCVTPPRSPCRKKSKSSSLASRESYTAAKRSAEILRPQLPYLTDSDALRLDQRQRKTISALSGRQSGPVKYRSSGLIVIYYDGDVQKRFDQVVKSISTGRNELRKNKMGMTVAALSRSGSSSSSDSNSEGEEFSPSSFKMRFPRTSRAIPSFKRDDGTQYFERIDKHLEKTIEYCERAAHQILRDGDCEAELVKAYDTLNEGLVIVNEKTPVLRKQADKIAARRQKSDERRKANGQDRRIDHDETPIVMHAMPPGEISFAEALEVDDDSDDTAGEYDVNTFQMGKMAAFRRAAPMNRYAAAPIL